MGTKLILKDETTRAQAETALAAMKLRANPPLEDDFEFRQTWISRDKQSGVDVVDGSYLKVRYLWVRGKDAESLETRLRAAVPVWSRDDLLKHALEVLVENDPLKIEIVAMQVACEMETYDIASGSVLTAFIKMDEPSTRLSGARAMRINPVPEFRSAAEDLCDDPDPEVADKGRELLARIMELHG